MTKSNSFQYLIKNICWYFSRIFVTLSCEVFLLNKRNKRFYQVKLNAPLREFVLTVPWFNLEIYHIFVYLKGIHDLYLPKPPETIRNHIQSPATNPNHFIPLHFWNYWNTSKNTPVKFVHFYMILKIPHHTFFKLRKNLS